MPEISWIDALRKYNLGGTGWCIPRRGTPAYETIMKIRKGEEAKTPKQLREELEHKTGGKPKVEKKSMTIDISVSAPASGSVPKKKRVIKVMVEKSPATKPKK